LRRADIALYRAKAEPRSALCFFEEEMDSVVRERDFLQRELGAVAGLVGNEGGVVSEVINLESSGVEAPDRRPRHDDRYHET